MSPHAQTIIALAIVVVTVALLVLRAFRKKSKPGCGGGDCGCAKSKDAIPRG